MTSDPTSLTTRLVHRRSPVIFFLLTMGPLALLAYYSITQTSSAITRQAQNSASAVAATNAAYIEQRFNGLVDTLKEYSQNSVAGDLGGTPSLAGIGSDLDKLVTSHNGPEQAFVTDMAGTLVTSPSDDLQAARPKKMLKTTLVDEEWYRGMVSGNRSNVFGMGVIGGVRDSSNVAIVAPVLAREPNGGVIGYLVGSYSIAWAHDLVQQFAVTHGVSLSLIDQNGNVMVTPQSLPGIITTVRPNDPLLVAMRRGRSGVQTRQGPRGSVFSAYVPLSSLSWSMVVDVSARQPLSTIASLQNAVLIVDGALSLILLGALLLGLFLLRRAQESAALRDRNESMRQLDEAARTVHSLHGQEAIDKLAVTAGELVGATFSGLTVLRPRGDHKLQAMAHRASIELLPEALPLLVEFLDQHVGPDQPARLADAMQVYPRERATSLPELGPLVSVPLLAGPQVLGRLVVARGPGGRPFNEINEGLLRQLAQHAVTAIQKRRQDEVRESFLEELRDKNDELEHVSRLKSEFLANMSHELRTPLSAIIGFSELLIDGTDGALNRDQSDDLGQIQRAGRSLLGLINDILDLSKIEAGRMNLEMADNDLKGIVAEALAAVRPLADARSIYLRSDLPDEWGTCHCDETRIRQVLTNLLSNAIKFTQQGGVTVRLQDLGELAEVWVIDTGIGIKADALGFIFEEFTQAEGGTTRKYGGTGLGLAISRKLVELQGGQIGVDSTEGEGSRFWFRLRRTVRGQVGPDLDQPGGASQAPSHNPAPDRRGLGP